MIRAVLFFLAAMAVAALAMAQPLPNGVRKLPDLPYGPDPLQRMDVYLPPPAAHDAPVLVMVHGGAWRLGGKAAASVVDLKVEHWVRDQGFVLVSVGYRLVPQVTPLQQAEDVARAVALAQADAPSWGADAKRLVLMGHSAGAHLVALVSASPTIARRQGVQPWLGTVVLDSAAVDTEPLMRRRHLPLYDFAFGSDPALWHAASPTAVLAPGVVPMLLVCSTRRPDDSCGQSRAFAERVAAVGGRALLLPEDLSHRQIDAALGLPGPYTEAVDDFMRSLSKSRATDAPAPEAGGPGR